MLLIGLEFGSVRENILVEPSAVGCKLTQFRQQLRSGCTVGASKQEGSVFIPFAGICRQNIPVLNKLTLMAFCSQSASCVVPEL